MKKICCVLLLGLLALTGLRAQSIVPYYGFEVEKGNSYTSLSDATSLTQMTEAAADDFPLCLFNGTETKNLNDDSPMTMNGISLGFDFTFDGQVFDKFVVSGMGYICLGLQSETQVTVDGGFFPSLSGLYRLVDYTIGASTPVQAICAAPAKYKLEGESGSQTMTIEFATKYEISEGAVFRYQIKLYEEDSKIEMLFDEFETDWDWDPFVVGICGVGETYYIQSSGGNFNEDLSRSTSNGGGMLSSLNFEKGLKYTFTLPAACEVPDAAGEITFTPASASVALELKKTTGKGDAFIVVASENPITENPVDGTVYEVGDELAGGTVIGVEEDLRWDSYTVEHSNRYENELKSNTKYYYAVWFYNYQCAGDNKYGAAITAETTTLTSAPESLEFTAVSLSEIKLKATANSSGQDILIAVTNEHTTDGTGVNIVMKGEFGIPAADARVGDDLLSEYDEPAGKVIYVGPAGTEITFSDVTDNKIYHFGAFSKGTDGKYSTVFAQADTISPAKMPFFEDFSNMIPFSMPVGWVGTDPDFTVNRNPRNLQYTFPENTGTVQEVNLVLPPMDYPDKPLRLIMDYNMRIFVNRMWAGYDSGMWEETDSIVFEVSKDGGETYTPSYAITQANADQFTSQSDYKTRTVTIRGLEGATQGKVRIRWHINKNSPAMTIQSIELMAVPDCDYPSMITVDPGSIVGDKASVEWVAGESGESAWNISYALKTGTGFGNWSEPLLIDQKPYQLENLAVNQTYKVRVQAVCGVGQISEWVESAEFTSGWTTPFIEDFDNVPMEQVGWRISMKFPNQWFAFIGDEKEGIFTPADMYSTELTEYVSYLEWKTDEQAMPGYGYNGSLAYPMNQLDGTVLLQLPVVHLDETDDAKFVFDAAFGAIENDEFAEATETDAEFGMMVLVSQDKGKTFVVADALQTWDNEDLVALGGLTKVEVDLSDYQGEDIVLALAVTGRYDYALDRQYLWIDNMGVLLDCAEAKGLKVENITETTAQISWQQDPLVDEWIVKVSDGNTSNRVATEENSIELTDLVKATRYTVAVARLCGEDTSAWASVNFTTAGVECDQITNVAVSEITRNSAKLTWTGDALSYRIRIRKAGSGDAWTIFTAQTEEYVLKPLLPLTEYEGGVQALCGDAAADTNAYVNFENFTTTDVTCLSPENLKAEPSWYYVKLTWEGDAENYQVSYRRDGSTAVLGTFNVAGKEYTLTGLEEKTPYQARVRSACGEGDTSAWCEWITFTTTETPACPVPTGLKAESITINSAALSWACEDEDAAFILRFRASAATSWDSVKNLTAMNYELKELEANTAYTWSVMSACSENRYSGWATAASFTTLEETANENYASADLRVVTGKGQIHILNPSAMMIDRVRILGTDGVMLENYRIGSNENVIIRTNQSMRVVVLLVESGNQILRYKVLLP